MFVFRVLLVRALLPEREQLADVIGQRVLVDVDLVDRDPGLELGPVADEQGGILDAGPVLALSEKSCGLAESGITCSTVASSPATCSVMSATMPVVAETVGPSSPDRIRVRAAGGHEAEAEGDSRAAKVFKGAFRAFREQC